MAPIQAGIEGDEVMRIELEEGDSIRITLSERNLKALLAKLTIPGSQCTLYLYSPNLQTGFYITAEPDDVHYDGRTPGRMSPETEELIQ